MLPQNLWKLSDPSSPEKKIPAKIEFSAEGIIHKFGQHGEIYSSKYNQSYAKYGVTLIAYVP